MPNGHRFDGNFLVEARVNYGSALRTAPYGVVITDPSLPDNPIVFANRFFLDLTDYLPEQVIGRNCRFLQGEDTDRATVSDLREAVRARTLIQRDILNYRGDGRPFWTDLTIIPTTDEAGAPSYLFGVLRDITAERDAKAQLEDADQQLASIVKNMPGYVFRRILKPDGAISYVGPTAGLPGNRTASALLGPWNPWSDIHPDDVDRVGRAVKRSAALITPLTVEFRTSGPNGELVWLRTSSTPSTLANGDIVWDGVGIDITREKMSEGILARVVDNLPGYVFQRVQKPDGTVTFPFIGGSFANLMGALDGAAAPIGDDLLEHLHPADVERVRRGIERSAANLSRLTLEFRLVFQAAEERWIRTYASPRREANGDIVWDGVGVEGDQ